MGTARLYLWKNNFLRHDKNPFLTEPLTFNTVCRDNMGIHNRTTYIARTDPHDTKTLFDLF